LFSPISTINKHELELESDADKDPPNDYLPKGWMVFQLLGLFAQPNVQMNFFSGKYTDGKTNDRIDFHQEQ
jgi:hypothetical protein